MINKSISQERLNFFNFTFNLQSHSWILDRLVWKQAKNTPKIDCGRKSLSNKTYLLSVFRNSHWIAKSIFLVAYVALLAKDHNFWQHMHETIVNDQSRYVVVGHGLHKFRWIAFSGRPADETVAQNHCLARWWTKSLFCLVFWENTILHQWDWDYTLTAIGCILAKLGLGYNPFPRRRWDSKWSRGCKSKSYVVMGFFCLESITRTLGLRRLAKFLLNLCQDHSHSQLLS